MRAAARIAPRALTRSRRCARARPPAPRARSKQRRLWLSGAYPHGVCDLDFSADGSALAIVTSSALEGGGGEEGEGGVWVREMAVGEYTPKARK